MRIKLVQRSSSCKRYMTSCSWYKVRRILQIPYASENHRQQVEKKGATTNQHQITAHLIKYIQIITSVRRSSSWRRSADARASFWGQEMLSKSNPLANQEQNGFKSTARYKGHAIIVNHWKTNKPGNQQEDREKACSLESPPTARIVGTSK